MHLKKQSVFAAAIVSVLIALTSPTFASVPQAVNYQGVLKSSAGTPVTGTVQMQFSLYTSETSTAPVWSEVTPTVSVANGRYSVVLGNVTPINLPFDVQYYLGVKVGADSEMLPRQPLTSAAYALRAATVQIIPCNPGDFVGCYTGPNGTKDVGLCKAGTRTCGVEASFGSCAGEVTPVSEVCGDNKDNDCNGVIDNGCPTCSDGIKNGNESDIDCGGSCGATCADEKTCNTFSDCVSNRCNFGHCAVPTCNDAVRNGNETDIDCGGSCPTKCMLGMSCMMASDCADGACMNNICEPPSCNDMTRNGTETDIDCGGNCSPCPDMMACAVPADCMSGACTSGICVVPTCSDMARNGQETDVDCGGLCSPCSTGKNCGKASDCVNGVCSAGKCMASSCTDGLRNGNESDIDCGGSCGACTSGKTCGIAADCQTGYCTAGVCQFKPQGAACSVNNECVTGHCADGLCTNTSCNQICTHSVAGICTNAVAGTDPRSECSGRYCNGAGACNPSCTDGIKNGNETDIDCGGSCSTKCADSKGCTKAADCVSNACIAGFCGAPSCTDLAMNGNETDVDCGGGTCSSCASGKACIIGNDCQTSVCTGNICVLPTSCKNIKTANPGASDGMYWIDPDGTGGAPSFQVYCDMTRDGGGWTLWANMTMGGTSASLIDPSFANYYMDSTMFATLYSASTDFKARGKSTGISFYLSKAEASAATCHVLSTSAPKNENAANQTVYGHTETAGCDMAGGDAAYLSITTGGLSVVSSSSVGLWHSGSSSGSSLNLNSNTSESKVEMWIR